MCFAFIIHRKKYEQKQKQETYPTFLELIDIHDEFAFSYNGIKYEIVYGDGYANDGEFSLYLANSKRGTYVRSFTGKDDFLKNGKIEGKYISEILDEIKV